MVLALSVFPFAFALWLGLYLIARDPDKRRLRYSGFGLLVYALALAADTLSAFAGDPALAATLAQVNRALIFLPAVFWSATAYTLSNEPPSIRHFDLGVWGVAAIFFIMGAAGDAAYTIADILATILLLLALVSAWRFARELQRKQRAGVLITAALFFSLTMGLIVLHLDWLPRDLLLFTLGFDLPFLGFAIAALDAFDEGEALLPDALRSLLISTFSALLFGGLVALGIVLNGAITFPLAALLFGISAAAILLQVFGDMLQNGVDRLALRRQPGMAQARAELRAAAEALPRLNPSLDPLRLDENEFARLTRRALSHMSDLPRLAASPLTQLPVIESRLAARGARADTLERAAELKVLLTECILRLKPDGKGDFGSTGEWRHYNALYFPYVVGLRPYSQNHYTDDLGEAERMALAWFRAEVPERTLHNWQNAAANLIAQQLMEINRLYA
jgi:hypothetical protein